MQSEFDTIWLEFDTLYFYAPTFVAVLLILSLHFMSRRAGRTMTQQRYSATIVLLSAVIAPLVILVPLGIVAVNHPGSIPGFLGYLMAEKPYCFVGLLLCVLIAVVGGWIYARVNPADERHEDQSESQPEPIEKLSAS